MFFNRKKKSSNSNSWNYNGTVGNLNSNAYYYSSNVENNFFKNSKSKNKDGIYEQLRSPYYGNLKNNQKLTNSKKNSNKNINNKNPYEYDLSRKFEANNINSSQSFPYHTNHSKSLELNDTCFSCKMTSITTTLGISAYLFYQSYSIKNSKELLKEIGPKKVLFRSRFASCIGLAFTGAAIYQMIYD
ncbi:hypothetical protein U3516DRAFT_824874 [Neocallimastix sp. 'constans']